MPILAENKGRYPKDWALRSRFIRFYRARNCCEWCGIPNGVYRNKASGEWTRNALQAETWRRDGDRVSRVVLTVAHVNDERPEACSFDNLAALCQACHNGHDMKGRAQRRRERLEARSGQLALPLGGGGTGTGFTVYGGARAGGMASNSLPACHSGSESVKDTSSPKCGKYGGRGARI